VSAKRKQKVNKLRAKPDVRIEGMKFKDVLRALLNTPPLHKSKHPH
jgi:hypothetical protein